MNIFDSIKNSVIGEFTGTIAVGEIFSSLIFAFLISIFIVFVYRKTYTGVIYSKSFSLCLILLTLVTAVIIRTINSNLSLSLGMVGALSIVRFRTAIKEPVDTIYMFWAISVGIMTGAGIYLIAVLASAMIGLLYFVSYLMGFKVSSKYLLIVKYNVKDDNNIMEKINNLESIKLKSKNITKDVVEASYEIALKDNADTVLNEFKNNDKVLSVSIISYQNDFGI